MDLAVRDRFAELWREHFPGAELPLAFYYTDDGSRAARAPGKGPHCFIAALEEVRNGVSLSFDEAAVGCGGGKRYLGFSRSVGPNFAYFLSCGIPGQVEGERYKKTPALVEEWMKHQPAFTAPGKFVVFKRWDALGADDEPSVVVFFAQPDVLSGLYTLACYDESDPDAVIAPMGSGCSSIVYYPYRESVSASGHAVLGMFDVSARPCVPFNALTLAVPWLKFERMIENMPGSFLVTRSWEKVRRRIASVSL